MEDLQIKLFQSVRNIRVKLLANMVKVYSAMNQGLDHATAKYVMFVNSDDEINSNGLSTALGEIAADQGATAHMFGVNMMRDNRIMGCWKPGATISRRFSMPAPHPGAVIKTDICKSRLRFDESLKFSADYQMMLRLQNLQGIICHDYPLVNFYVGGASEKFAAIIENIKIRNDQNLSIFSKTIGLLYDLRRFLLNILHN
jgi:glycosyltransferase involved in cell wall biosynthesis